MQAISRDQLKKLFSEVKHFRVAEDFDEVNFADLTYYSFFDQTDFVFYTIYEFDGEFIGIRWNCARPPRRPLTLGLCDICRKHRKSEEIVSVYAKTRHLPLGVNYRTRGFQICFDFRMCNEDMKNTECLTFIYNAILKH